MEKIHKISKNKIIILINKKLVMLTVLHLKKIIKIINLMKIKIYRDKLLCCLRMWLKLMILKF